MSLRGTKQSLLYAITTVDCGFRTAGEVLFCYSPKEYPEKAAPHRLPREKHSGCLNS